MFARHYHLDIVQGHRSDFGKQVVKLAASSAADAAVRRALGNEPSTSSLATYRIPKLSKLSE